MNPPGPPPSPSDGVEALTMDVDGGRARVLRRRGPGATVVLVHGAGGNAETWRPTLGDWGWADVWCPDLPGRGGSDGPARETAAETARWLLALGRAAGWDAPLLVGHSYGGAVALSAALAEPAAVRGLGLVSSGARLRVAPAILDAAARATREQPMPIAFAFGPGTDRSVVDAYQRAAADTPPAAAVADWQACDAFDVRDRLGTVDVPSLVLFGEGDALTPAKHQHRMADALPRATVEAVPDAGHMLPWEAPDRVSATIRRRLAAPGG